MPKDEFDPQDPLEPVAVELPADEDTLAPMAEAFIEEFMWMGYWPNGGNNAVYSYRPPREAYLYAKP